MPSISPPDTHEEAKAVLEQAYTNLFGDDVNLFALGIAQAIGVMEGAKYGHWGPDNQSNNWGAITRPINKDGTCPVGSFGHQDSSFETGKYNACFAAYDTPLAGATDLLHELYERRPAVFEAALAGDIRGVAREMYASGYYTGVAPHGQKDENGDFTNVNNYIAFIGRGVDQISYLYPHGEDSGSDSIASGNGLVIGLGVLAIGGLALVMSSKA